MPPWLETGDIFVNDEAFARIQTYFRGLLHTAGSRSNFLGFDLGNKMNVMVLKLALEYGDAWGRRITDWLRPQLGGKWFVNGVDHAPWFSGQTFSPGHLVDAYNAVTIHAWPYFTGCLLDQRLSGQPAVRLTGFMAQLASHFQRQAGVKKPV